MADTEATTNEDTDTFYSDWMRFCDCMIAREQKKKGEGVPLTYKDYQPIDHINFTGTQGIDEFMKKYTPGPKIVDVGAGMGGACRILAEEYGAEPIGIEYTQTFIDLGNRISRDLGMPEYLRWGDATQPLGVENADAVFCYGVLNAMPRDLKVTAVKRMFDAVK